MKKIIGVVLIVAAVLLGAVCREALPKSAPGTNNMALKASPSFAQASVINLVRLAGAWEIKDFVVVKVATMQTKDGAVRMIGLPDGKWWLLD